MIIDLIGQKTISALLYAWRLFAFTLSSLFSIRSSGGSRPRNHQRLVSQIIFSGVDALPTITILSLAIAFSLAAQFLLMLQSLTSEKEVIQVVSQIIAQELAPLLTAIILIGRSGSAITVDLGNMRLHQEIRGLELLGVNIKEFFVLPRILGLAFSQFTLAIYFSGMVMVAGIIFSALLDSPSNYKYLFLLAHSFTPYELLIFIVKNLLFGIIIGAIACFHGLRVEHSVTELPQQTQQAIVNSLVLIFIIDGLIAVAT